MLPCAGQKLLVPVSGMRTRPAGAAGARTAAKRSPERPRSVYAPSVGSPLIASTPSPATIPTSARVQARSSTPTPSTSPACGPNLRARAPNGPSPSLRGRLSYFRRRRVRPHPLFEPHQPPAYRRLKHQPTSIGVKLRQQIEVAALWALECLLNPARSPYGFAVLHVGAPAAMAATDLLHGSPLLFLAVSALRASSQGGRRRHIPQMH